ncbi:glycoside hydrolase family 43 protein [Phytoactinopolyspora endophytica]|uniref:glycoside hydrolase family 43 protein n=1 Tax=Phytoactinopolyspora endophytica TaxID=1642495 RepID=UPI00101B82D7|nr:glycoside hydrolase family 43 protein [Phytoactinopolyspora endophytica]
MNLPNPQLPGFNPDPSVVCVDDAYYLATSTFEYLPGIPIYASRDFVDWEQIGNVATRPGQLADDVPTAGGAWAPTLRHRDGVFHLVVTDAMGRGALHFTATRPEGPWSDGTPLGIDGVDPDLAWDEDGTAYITYSALSFAEGRHRGIEQVRVDLVAGRVLEPPRSLWSGTGLQFPEAPHLYRRDDWWYLLLAEGGTERGHSVSIARAKTPDGPFEPAPVNPRLSARSTDRPVQNTGHSDLVQGPDGEWLLVLLGVRPRGMTRAFSALGRETFVTRAQWVDGWPEFEPVPLAPRPGVVRFRDDFDSAEFAPQWLGVRRLPEQLGSLSERSGFLVLAADGSTLDDARPVFIGRRQEHQTARAVVRVDVRDGVGGLAVRYDESSYYSIEAGGGTVVARARLKGLTQEWAIPFTDTDLELAITSRRPRDVGPIPATSDVVELSAVIAGEETVLASVDGRYLSAEVTESFTGRVIGMFARDGVVAVDWFDYEGSDA